jgi:hypothetical protein
MRFSPLLTSANGNFLSTIWQRIVQKRIPCLRKGGYPYARRFGGLLISAVSSSPDGGQGSLRGAEPRLWPSERPIGKRRREVVCRAIHGHNPEFNRRRQRRLDRRNVVPSLPVGADRDMKCRFASRDAQPGGIACQRRARGVPDIAARRDFLSASPVFHVNSSTHRRYNRMQRPRSSAG